MFLILRLGILPHKIRRTIARLREGTAVVGTGDVVDTASIAAAAGIRSISWRGRRLLRRGRQIISDCAARCCCPRRCPRPAHRRSRRTSRGVGTPSRLHLLRLDSHFLPSAVCYLAGSRLSASFLRTKAAALPTDKKINRTEEFRFCVKDASKRKVST